MPRFSYRHRFFLIQHFFPHFCFRIISLSYGQQKKKYMRKCNVCTRNWFTSDDVDEKVRESASNIATYMISLAKSHRHIFNELSFHQTEHPSQIEHNTPFTVVLVVVAHSDAHSNVPSFCDAKEMNYTPSTWMEVIEIMIYSPLMVYHSTAHVIGAVFSLHPSFSISF